MLFILILSTICGCKKKESTAKIERENWWLWSANWSSNGEQIAFGGTQDTLRLFSSATNSIVENVPIQGTITKTEWHPSKNKLAISIQDGKNKSLILNLETKKRILLDRIDENGARAIGWNKNGELLAVGDYSGFLNIYNEDGELLKRINTKQKALIALHWHPKNNIIAAVGEKISVYNFENDTLFDVKPRKEEVLMLCVAWHPSGEFFVTGDYGDFEKDYPPLLQFWTSKGKNLRNIENSKAEFRNMAWSNDGELLATASEFLGLWNKKGDLIRKYDSENLLWGIDWNNSDEKIVTSDDKGKIMIWEINLDTSIELKY